MVHRGEIKLKGALPSLDSVKEVPAVGGLGFTSATPGLDLGLPKLFLSDCTPPPLPPPPHRPRLDPVSCKVVSALF